DRRLTRMELESLPERYAAFDQDGDGGLTPSELPLVVELNLQRNEPGLALLRNAPMGPMATGQDPADWFSAMDVNADGVVDLDEFLGETTDFQQLDADSDGFISRREVYQVEPGNGD
ncbi:MAG: hypothetical protein D6753_10870, partial [Planctomycetota bacterium]